MTLWEVFEIKPFIFRTAGKVIFGARTLRKLPDELKNFPPGKVLIVTDENLSKTEIVEHVIREIEISGREHILYDGVTPEPRVEQADRAGELAKECALVIGVGGGSSIDVAKGASVVASHGGKARDYIGVNKVPRRGIPIVAIPTTAGTGSEVTPTAVFLFDERKKGGINSPHIIPDLAILDPELTVTLPPSLTASTGMDALTHALESYVARSSNSMSEMFSLEALKLISQNIRIAYAVPDNIEAREGMLFGSFLAGIALAHAGVGACHSMSYPLGAFYGIGHGLANSVLIPHVSLYNAIAVPHKYALVASILGEKAENLSLRDAAFSVYDALLKLLYDLNLPVSLADLGVPEEDLPRLAASALEVERPLANNPRRIGYEEIYNIYREVYNFGREEGF
ncbi:MAG: iron-containing alcohol dehydrogenase [Synergistetes bacterium]|nr:MAG: Alcohol dehydrogenase [bacterium 42_11]MBC7330803.1 iron-containing alcohol dehydrogenase [Synergistota bacterium]